MYGVSNPPIDLVPDETPPANCPKALHPESSVMFVSKASVSRGGDVPSYNLKKQVEVVKNCRTVTKNHMKYNSATPKVAVDAKTLVSCTVPV